jgi:pimeloyl-ACP methyl ester carboxylesterase
MGADERLFAAHRAAFPHLVIPPWPEPQASETLEHYGARMAEGLQVDEPFYLGGASLGGMVALEIARHRRPEAVCLIGSCRSGRCVPLHWRVLVRALRPAPARFVTGARWAVSPVARRLQRFTRDQERLFRDMFARTPVRFLRWASAALLAWSFRGELACPVRHIHGEHDTFLPLRRMRPDRVVAGGGHVLSLTHPEEVNAFLLETIAAASRPRQAD